MQLKPTIKAYKYRIYPNDAQLLFFAKTFDSGWSKFLTYLRYKAEWYGKTFIQIDRFFPSSKLCHCCGHKNEDLTLHDRTWCCPACGETHDRDINASINLYFVGLGRPEVKPVEQALVDDRSPTGYLKSHPATKQEA